MIFFVYLCGSSLLNEIKLLLLYSDIDVHHGALGKSFDYRLNQDGKCSLKEYVKICLLFISLCQGKRKENIWIIFLSFSTI